jgi:protein-S-isoprenylcysteine O-methyltransferase Ste14
MNALKTFLWSVFVPGTLTTLVPYVLLSSGFESFGVRAGVWRWLGLIPVAAGAALYVRCAWGFTVEGRGTPAPFDPPKEFVAGGPYRYVRNPMYVAVTLALAGEAWLFGSGLVLAYAALVFSFFHVWVVCYEEPTLRRAFGESYVKYLEMVPRWVPAAAGVPSGT